MLLLNHYVTVYPRTCPLTWLTSFQYATALVTDALVGVCLCVCVWVRCQHFITNRSAECLSPHFKDVARRSEAHLCHGWHFNLSLLAVLFPSIVHQCIRTNAMGHKGIFGFDIIDTYHWLRLCCCSLQRSLSQAYIGVSGEERRTGRVRWQKIIPEEKRERSNLQTYKSPLKYRHVGSWRGRQENYKSFPKQWFISVEHFLYYIYLYISALNLWTFNQHQRCMCSPQWLTCNHLTHSSKRHCANNLLWWHDGVNISVSSQIKFPEKFLLFQETLKLPAE